MAKKISALTELPDAFDLGDGYIEISRGGASYKRLHGYKITDAETAAGVTPVNYQIPSHDVVGYINVARYGDVTSGANITTAFLSAVAVARSVQTRDWIVPKVVVNGGPDAVYTITTTITNDKYPIHFFGNGCLLFSNTVDIFRIGSDANPGPEYSVPSILEGFVLSAFPTASEDFLFTATNNGVYVKDCGQVKFRDMTILGFGVGINHDGSLVIDHESIQFRCNAIAVKGRQGTGGPSSATNMHTYRNCQFMYNRKIFDYVTGSVACKQCDFENNNPNNTASLTGMSFTSMGGIAATAAVSFEDCDNEGQTYDIMLNFGGSDANKTLRLVDYRDHSTSGTQLNVTQGRIIWENITLANATVNNYQIASGVTGLIIEGLFQGASPSSADSFSGITHIAGGHIVQCSSSGGISGSEKQSVTYDGSSQYGTTYKTTSAGNDGYAQRYYNPAGTLVGSIYQQNTGTTFNTTSDERLKTGLTPLEEQGYFFDAVMVYEGAFRSDPMYRMPMFVAQQLAPLAPEAVTIGGEDADTNPWQVDESKLIRRLVKEIQSIRIRLKALE